MFQGLLERTTNLVLRLCAVLSVIGLGGCNGAPARKAPPDAAVPPEVPRTAKIVFWEGDVRVKRGDSMEWLPAEAGLALGIDDKVRTLRDSFVTIEFERGGVLRVGPESLVAVSDLRHEPKSEVRKTTFTLVEGKVEAELEELKDSSSEFRIRTPSAEAAVLRREVSFQ